MEKKKKNINKKLKIKNIKIYYEEKKKKNIYIILI